MHAITADSKLGPSRAGFAPPIQNPIRIATESASHKTLYMPSRLTTSQDVGAAFKGPPLALSEHIFSGICHSDQDCGGAEAWRDGPRIACHDAAV